MTAMPAHHLFDAEAGGAPLQQRERRATNLRGQATRDDGRVVAVTIVDLSHDGCGIDSLTGFRPGEVLKLAVDQRGTVSAVVRWAAGTKAGLVFAEERSAEGPRTHAPRAYQRVQVGAEVSLRRAGKLQFRVRVYDASPDGCKAEFVERPELGEQLWVKFDGIDALESRVCWVAGSKAGLKFTRPIHAAVFDMLLQRIR